MTLPSLDFDTLKAELVGVEAVFFDLDDTLCGYWDASKAALRATFDTHLGDLHSPETMVAHWAETYREFAPMVKRPEWYLQYLASGDATRREHMRRTLHRIGISDDTLTEALSATYRGERNRRLQLFPDALETLENLAKRFPLGLITNGPADIQREEIATLGIGSYFSHFFIEGEMGEGKPLPAVFDRAEAAVGFSAEAILMVGNSFGHDIKPAIAAGWKTIWMRRESDVAPSAQAGAKPEAISLDGPLPTAILSELAPLIKLLP